jgi:hypothetical protein
MRDAAATMRPGGKRRTVQAIIEYPRPAARNLQ